MGLCHRSRPVDHRLSLIASYDRDRSDQLRITEFSTRPRHASSSSLSSELTILLSLRNFTDGLFEQGLVYFCTFYPKHINYSPPLVLLPSSLISTHFIPTSLIFLHTSHLLYVNVQVSSLRSQLISLKILQLTHYCDY